MKRLVGLAALVILMAGCAPSTPPLAPATGGQAQPSAVQRSSNQSLTVAKVGFPGAITTENSSSNMDIMLAVFDTLVTYEDDFKIVPAVAEKWEFRPANNAWYFTIRKDLEFSNGQKLTVDDVVYSTNLIHQNNTAVRSYLLSMTKAEKVDDSTVAIFTNPKDLTMIEGAPFIAIFPEKYHREVGKEFGVKPIGSGPYELVEFKAADRIAFKLRSKPHPFRKPIATDLIFRSIPEPFQQIQGLRTGEIDIAKTNFTTDQADQLKKSGMTVISKLTEMNIAPFGLPEMQLRNTPLQDRRVRLALNYAINKEIIAREFYKGFAEPTGQFGYPDSPLYNPDLKAFPYDPARAKQLLAEAGYPNGFTLTGGFNWTPQTASQEMVLAVLSDLKAIGVQIEANTHEFGAYLDLFYGRKEKGDIILYTNGNSTPNASGLKGKFDCSAEGFALYWCSRDFIQLYDQALGETDTTKRNDLFRRAATAVREEVPAIFLVSRASFIVHTDKIRGVQYATRVVHNYDSAYRIN